MRERWLGLDPGLALIGWAVLETGEQEQPKLLDCGTIETDKNLSTSQRLLEIEQDMVSLIGQFKPNQIAVEMPFFGRQIKAAGGVMQALGVVSLVSYREAGVEPIFLHQSSWKCNLGNGRATKAEIAEIIQQIFTMKVLPIDDSVDAIGIAFAAINGVRNQIN